MPIYEYRCAACNRKSSIFFRSLSTVEERPACPRCRQRRLERVMSRVWSRRSRQNEAADEPVYEQDGVPFYGGEPDEMIGEAGDDLWDSETGDDDVNVAELVREARETAQMMGEPLDPELDTALTHIEQGADPDDVFGELDERTATDEPDGN